MSMKRVSYKNLLKEAILEFTDVPKNVEVKGPFLDGIMKWDGGGELPTSSDAASILERYYFNEDQDGGVEISVEDESSSSGESMKDAKGEGTDQAGTSVASTVAASKAEKEKDIMKEEDDLDDADIMKEMEDLKDEDEDDEDDITEEIENAVIEKLIAEMEVLKDEGEDDEEDDEDDITEEIENVVIEKLIAEMEEPDDHDTGAGTEQAGTGDSDKLVPERKDSADKMVKPKTYSEQDKIDDEEEEEEEELDVDEKIKEDAGVGGGPIKAKGSMGKPGMGEDEEDIEETFRIFKEQLEDEDEDEDGDKEDIKV